MVVVFIGSFLRKKTVFKLYLHVDAGKEIISCPGMQKLFFFTLKRFLFFSTALSSIKYVQKTDFLFEVLFWKVSNDPPTAAKASFFMGSYFLSNTSFLDFDKQTPLQMFHYKFCISSFVANWLIYSNSRSSPTCVLHPLIQLLESSTYPSVPTNGKSLPWSWGQNRVNLERNMTNKSSYLSCFVC